EATSARGRGPGWKQGGGGSGQRPTSATSKGAAISTSTPWATTARVCTRPSHGRCTRTPGGDRRRRPSAPLRRQFRPAERGRGGPASRAGRIVGKPEVTQFPITVVKRR